MLRPRSCVASCVWRLCRVAHWLPRTTLRACCWLCDARCSPHTKCGSAVCLLLHHAWLASSCTSSAVCCPLRVACRLLRSVSRMSSAVCCLLNAAVARCPFPVVSCVVFCAVSAACCMPPVVYCLVVCCPVQAVCCRFRCVLLAVFCAVFPACHLLFVVCCPLSAACVSRYPVPVVCRVVFCAVPAACCMPPVVYCLVVFVRCTPSVVFSTLSFPRCLLSVAFCPLPVARCMLRCMSVLVAAGCLRCWRMFPVPILHVVCCSLYITGCMLSGCCLLHVSCHVVCCMLHVVRCLLRICQWAREGCLLRYCCPLHRVCCTLSVAYRTLVTLRVGRCESSRCMLHGPRPLSHVVPCPSPVPSCMPSAACRRCRVAQSRHTRSASRRRIAIERLSGQGMRACVRACVRACE
jgi:hypothetical protein